MHSYASINSLLEGEDDSLSISSYDSNSLQESCGTHFLDQLETLKDK